MNKIDDKFIDKKICYLVSVCGMLLNFPKKRGNSEWQTIPPEGATVLTLLLP